MAVTLLGDGNRISLVIRLLGEISNLRGALSP